MPSTSFSRSGDVDSRDSIRCQPFVSSTASWVLSVRGHARWGTFTTGHSSRQGTCWRRSHASRTPATTVPALSPVNSVDKPTRGSRTARLDADAQVTRIQGRTAPTQRPARRFGGSRSRFSKRKPAAPLRLPTVPRPSVGRGLLSLPARSRAPPCSRVRALEGVSAPARSSVSFALA